MSGTKVSVTVLKALDPLSSLSDVRLQELAGLCYVETVSRNQDPFRLCATAGQSVYLLRGELALAYSEGRSEVLVGGSVDARYPLGKRRSFFRPRRLPTYS